MAIDDLATHTTCLVRNLDDWRNFLLRRVSSAPVHVIVLCDDGLASILQELCTHSEAYAIYIIESDGAPDLSLPQDCDTPVFLVANEAVATWIAQRLTLGDFTVYKRAVNGDDMLYGGLGSPT